MLSEKIYQLADFFPQELSINFKNGNVSTNVQEPYFIKLPPEFLNQKNVQPPMSSLENAIVIDTKDKFDLAKFNSYKTFALLTSDSIVYINNKNQITINSLAGVKDFTLNKSVIISCIDKIKPFIVFIYPLVFVGAYIAGFLVNMILLIYLLFGALVIWLIATIKKIKIGYAKSYQLGLHLMTFVIIATSLYNLIPHNIIIPFLFTIILILSVVFNLQKDSAQTNA